MTKKYNNGIPNGYKSNVGGFVYFAKAHIQGKELIKIGFYNGDYRITNNLKSRYKSVFEILKVIPGTGDTEQALHMLLDKYRCIVKYDRKTKTGIRTAVCTEFFQLPEKVIEWIGFLPQDQIPEIEYSASLYRIP